MDRSRAVGRGARGGAREVVFGPSTSMNTYVLAQAFGATLRPVTRSSSRTRTTRPTPVRSGGRPSGQGRRCANGGPTPTPGCSTSTVRRTAVERTVLVTVPHASNVVGQENDIARIAAMAHGVGARVIVDGVSFAPHSLPDVGALDADVYLFSLYKTYSVHQGLMVVRNGLLDELPNQSHFFNDTVADKRLNPAGPDHAQVGVAGAVLDYVELLHRHHGGSVRRTAHGDGGLGTVAAPRGFADPAAARRTHRPRRRSSDRAGARRARRVPPLPDRRLLDARHGAGQSPTNWCSEASRPARGTTTLRGCSTASVWIPDRGVVRCRSSTTRPRADVDRAVARVARGARLTVDAPPLDRSSEGSSSTLGESDRRFWRRHPGDVVRLVVRSIVLVGAARPHGRVPARRRPCREPRRSLRRTSRRLPLRARRVRPDPDRRDPARDPDVALPSAFRARSGDGARVGDRRWGAHGAAHRLAGASRATRCDQRAAVVVVPVDRLPVPAYLAALVAGAATASPLLPDAWRRVAWGGVIAAAWCDS